MDIIDSTELLEDAHRIIGIGADLIKKLEIVEKDTSAKEETYSMIKMVIETQSAAIRRLVEQQVEINDILNNLIENHKL